MSLKESVIGFLLGQLGHRAGRQGHELGAAITLPPDAEHVVRAALLPDPDRAIDALFENLYPSTEIEGFTSQIYPNDVDEDAFVPIRKVLSAGAALQMVRPDRTNTDRCYVHPEFYKLLSRIRGHMHGGNSTGLELTISLTDKRGERIIASATEGDLVAALDEFTKGLSEFVILAREWDYIQVARNSKLKPEEQETFRLECRFWLNESFYEHFCLWEEGGRETEIYDDIAGVKRAMLHWLRSRRLPENVKATNMTDAFRQFERHTASGKESSSRKIGYWIQHADFTSKEYEPVDAVGAELALRKHDWATARGFMRALRRSKGRDSGDFCEPGIGFLTEDKRVLHICPSENASALICYLGPLPAEGEERDSCDADDQPPVTQYRALQLFYRADYEGLKRLLNGAG